MNTKDRIRLAEAMGWHKADSYVHEDSIGGWSPKGDITYAYRLPNPTENANDDYAVLEWMRGHDNRSDEYCRFRDAMFLTGTSMNRGMWNYQIGDYARAALVAIIQQPTEAK